MRIGLTMIVKDEAEVIGRCLDSVFGSGMIDYYVIVDTGSTDDTLRIVAEKAYEYKLDGIVQHIPFTDFSSCRNASLDALRGKTDWGFWIDADEVLVIEDEFDAEEFVDSISMNDHSHVLIKEGNIEYYRNNLFRIKDSVRWRGKVHEYLTSEGYFEKAQGIHIDRHFDGHSWKNRNEKLQRYVDLLEAQIKAEPKESRWVYFLADTLRMAQTPATDRAAIDYYLQRIKMGGGNIEEIYVSRVMVASLKFKIYKVKDYKILEECNGNKRAEHLVTMAKFSIADNNYEKAYLYLRDAYLYAGCPPLVGSAIVDAALYYFGIAYFFANVCFITQRYQDSFDALTLCRGYIKYATPLEIEAIEEGFELLKEKLP